MKNTIRNLIIAAAFFLLPTAALAGSYSVSVSGPDILFNGQEIKILGLRMSNALISDAKAQELIENLDVFKSYGVNTVSVFLMGSRFGDIKGFHPDGTLDPVYAARLGTIIEAADARGMIVQVGCLYWGTSSAKADLGGWGQSDANTAVANTVQWLSDNNYRNVIVDADNEGMSPWDVGQMCTAGHAVDNTIVIGNNQSGDENPECDLNIHFGPKVRGKPWYDSEATPDPGFYWSNYSKQTHVGSGNTYYNYSRIGRYTQEQKNIQISQTTDEMANWNGNMLASTWLQCAPDEGVGGPFMTPGGRSEIADVNANIDDIHPDAGILWWLEHIQANYGGAWVPPEAGTSVGKSGTQPGQTISVRYGTGEKIQIMYASTALSNPHREVSVYDIFGTPAGHLAQPVRQGNALVFSWDGKNADGVRARPGIYIVRIGHAKARLAVQ